MNEKLQKIVTLAKRGEGGEKETAIALVRKLCAQHGLSFDEVMSDEPKVQEYFLRYSNKHEKKLVHHVICKFALMKLEDGVWGRRYQTGKMYFETTPERYIDTVNAWDILRKQLRREMDNLPLAMVMKHDLWYQPTPEEWEKIRDEKDDLDEEEVKRRARARMMAYGLEDVELQRRLKA